MEAAELSHVATPGTQLLLGYEHATDAVATLNTERLSTHGDLMQGVNSHGFAFARGVRLRCSVFVPTPRKLQGALGESQTPANSARDSGPSKDVAALIGSGKHPPPLPDATGPRGLQCDGELRLASRIKRWKVNSCSSSRADCRGRPRRTTTETARPGCTGTWVPSDPPSRVGACRSRARLFCSGRDRKKIAAALSVFGTRGNSYELHSVRDFILSRSHHCPPRPVRPPMGRSSPQRKQSSPHDSATLDCYRLWSTGALSEYFLRASWGCGTVSFIYLQSLAQIHWGEL